MQNIIIPKLVGADLWVDTWMAIAALAEIEVAALNDDAGFFRKRVKHRHRFTEAVYIVAALAGGAQVAEWAGQQQIENVLAELGGLEIKGCMVSHVRLSWATIWPTVMQKIMEIPLLRKYAVYHAASLGARTLAELHRVEKITREECILWGGSVIQKSNKAAKKYLIKACGLSRSDFASVGLRFPVAN
jgi:hypothetical protein